MGRFVSSPPFHLAFPIVDLEATRRFYVEVLGCTVGREAAQWIDFDFYGHQLSAHVRPEECQMISKNAVDGDQVPVRHFGCVLDLERWARLRERLEAAEADFIIEPRVRFRGRPGEQATMFIRDPSGNALEFKAFADMGQLFSPQDEDPT